LMPLRRSFVFRRFRIYKDAAPMGLRKWPVRDVLGGWLDGIVEPEGFLKFLTVRNLVLRGAKRKRVLPRRSIRKAGTLPIADCGIGEE